MVRLARPTKHEFEPAREPAMASTGRLGFHQHAHAWGSWQRARLLGRSLGLLAAGMVVFVATAPDAQATCRGRNFVDRLSLFVNGTARATSSNGETYDNILAGSFDADYSITLCGDGALDGVIVHLGKCTGHRRGCDAPSCTRSFHRREASPRRRRPSLHPAELQDKTSMASPWSLRLAVAQPHERHDCLRSSGNCMPSRASLPP